MEAKKKNTASINLGKFFSKDNLPLLSLIFVGIFSIVAIVISIVAFSINPVIACVMVILEAALAATLNRIPLWIHGLVFIAQVVCGIMASQVPFMLFMVFIYVFATAFLYIWANR